MRKLRFIVDGLSLKQDPACSFDGLFPTPNQDIEAIFTFSKDWDGLPRVVGFYSMLGKEHPPQIIDEDGRCIIPPEALNLPAFKLQVLGVIRGKTMTTNMLTVYQKGGRV